MNPALEVGSIVRSHLVLIGAALAIVAAGCSHDDQPDVENAKEFERFPIYWVGDTFEGHELRLVNAGEGIAAGSVSREG